MNSILNIGLQGIRRGLESAEINSFRVVDSFLPDSTEDPVEPLVALQADKRQVQASLRIVKTGDEMIGAVLDILG
jgi:hypothetical protein